MRFNVGDIVVVNPGSNDQDHGGETGVVVGINESITGVVVATNYSTDTYPAEPEAEAYQVGFPPVLGEWKNCGWYTEDQLEQVD